MPSNDQYQNAPHLQPRLAVQGGSHPPGIGQDETSSAIALEQLTQDGDLGGVRRFLHEAEHHLGPFRPDPWRLLEHLAAKTIARLSGSGSGAPGTGDGVNVSPQPLSDMAAGSEGGQRDSSPAPDRPASRPAPGADTA